MEKGQLYKQHPSTSQPLTDLLLQKKVTEVNSSTLPITMMMMKGGGGGQVARIKCLFLRRVVSSLLPAGTALSSAVHFELFNAHSRLTYAQYTLHTSQCKHNKEWLFHWALSIICTLCTKVLTVRQASTLLCQQTICTLQTSTSTMCTKVHTIQCTLYMMQTYLFIWMLFRSEAKSDFTRTKSKKYKFTTCNWYEIKNKWFKQKI